MINRDYPVLVDENAATRHGSTAIQDKDAMESGGLNFLRSGGMVLAQLGAEGGGIAILLSSIVSFTKLVLHQNVGTASSLCLRHLAQAGVLIGMLLVDSLGRRPLLIAGGAGSALCMVALALAAEGFGVLESENGRGDPASRRRHPGLAEGVESPTEGVNSPAEGVNSPAEGVNSPAEGGRNVKESAR
eukprot:352074-Prorocentrum_minimum.AAC.3